MIICSRYVHHYRSYEERKSPHSRRNFLLKRSTLYLSRRTRNWVFREAWLLVVATIIAVMVSAGTQLVSAVPAPKVVPPPRKAISQLHYTTATWYGPGLYSHTLKNGEQYPIKGLFAAHRTLPIGTMIKVTNLRNGRSVVVMVLDWGPYYDQARRGLDLSVAAARSIGMLQQGVVPVSWIIQAQA